MKSFLYFKLFMKTFLQPSAKCSGYSDYYIYIKLPVSFGFSFLDSYSYLVTVAGLLLLFPRRKVSVRKTVGFSCGK